MQISFESCAHATAECDKYTLHHILNVDRWLAIVPTFQRAYQDAPANLHIYTTDHEAGQSGIKFSKAISLIITMYA